MDIKEALKNFCEKTGGKYKENEVGDRFECSYRWEPAIKKPGLNMASINVAEFKKDYTIYLYSNDLVTSYFAALDTKKGSTRCEITKDEENRDMLKCWLTPKKVMGERILMVVHDKENGERYIKFDYDSDTDTDIEIEIE